MLKQIGSYVPNIPKLTQEIWAKTKSTHLVMLVAALATAILIKKCITYLCNSNLSDKKIIVPQQEPKNNFEGRLINSNAGTAASQENSPSNTIATPISTDGPKELKVPQQEPKNNFEGRLINSNAGTAAPQENSPSNTIATPISTEEPKELAEKATPKPASTIQPKWSKEDALSYVRIMTNQTKTLKDIEQSANELYADIEKNHTVSINSYSLNEGEIYDPNNPQQTSKTFNKERSYRLEYKPLEKIVCLLFSDKITAFSMGNSYSILYFNNEYSEDAITKEKLITWHEETQGKLNLLRGLLLSDYKKNSLLATILITFEQTYFDRLMNREVGNSITIHLSNEEMIGSHALMDEIKSLNLIHRYTIDFKKAVMEISIK